MVVRRIPRAHIVIDIPKLKLENLLGILGDIKETDGRIYRVVILTNSDSTARMLAYELNQHKIRGSAVYSSMKQSKQRRAADGFNDGKFEALIVSKSGLDVETGDINHFINYDMIIPITVNIFKKILRPRRIGR